MNSLRDDERVLCTSTNDCIKKASKYWSSQRLPALLLKETDSMLTNIKDQSSKQKQKNISLCFSLLKIIARLIKHGKDFH